MGFALWGLARQTEALNVFEAVLEHSPARESTLVSAAQLAGTLNRSGLAVALWHRAIAVDPWRSDYYADLAQQLVERSAWPEARDASAQALRLSPANRTAHRPDCRHLPFRISPGRPRPV